MMSDILEKVKAFEEMVNSPSLRAEMRDLKCQNEGLSELVKQLVGDLVAARQIARIEKTRGDNCFEELQKIKKGEIPLAKHGQVHSIMAIVEKWMNFVKYETTYCKHVVNWPSPADVSHSSLLFRMLQGEEPLSAEKYDEWKNTKADHFSAEK